MTKIKRIGVVSLGKMFGIVYAILGLIIGAVFSLISLIGVSMSHNGHGGAGIIFGIGAIILIPIIYGVCGFISGAIGAAIYNIAAHWVGGLELEIETVSAVNVASTPSSSTIVS